MSHMSLLKPESQDLVLVEQTSKTTASSSGMCTLSLYNARIIAEKKAEKQNWRDSVLENDERTRTKATEATSRARSVLDETDS